VQTEGGRARLVFYGASHVAADFYTDVVRSKLQARFGEAGAGFVLPAKPVAGYRNAAINIGRATGFHGVNVLAKAPLSDRYGLAGAYLRTRRKGASGWFETRAHAGLPGHASRFELYYLKQRGGGHLRVTIDGVAHEIPTEAHDYTTAYQTFEVADGAHRFELEAIGDGPTHTFGVSVERDVPGVVLDTLGIPGARVRYHLLWQDAIYREHLARLKPSLVVLAYGTNEAGDDDVPIEKYANDLQAVLARIRSVVPNASCLLIGPSDHPISNGNGTYSDRPRTAEIIAAQRQAAERFGCGFFDLVAFMGGPLSMLRWTAAVPPFGTPDHIHFMRRGYEELGRVLYDGLMAGYSEHPLSPEPSPPTPPPQPTAADASVTAASPDTPQSP
jgi:lysophospholipase L1-like esterase